MRRDPRETEWALRDLAGAQEGYFTAGQALKVGYSYPQQHFHRQRGNWEEIDRGILRLRDYPHTPHEDLVRWALWSRDRHGKIQAVVSHLGAFMVYDISDAMPAEIDLTVPPGFRKRAPGGCRLHRARLAPSDIERRPGFLVTSPLRSILDVAEDNSIDAAHLVQGLRDALRLGWVGRPEVDSLQPKSEAGRSRLAMAIQAAE